MTPRGAVNNGAVANVSTESAPVDLTGVSVDPATQLREQNAALVEAVDKAINRIPDYVLNGWRVDVVVANQSDIMERRYHADWLKQLVSGLKSALAASGVK